MLLSVIVVVLGSSACTRESSALPAIPAKSIVEVHESPQTHLTAVQRADLQATADASWQRVQRVWGATLRQAGVVSPRLDVVTGSLALAQASGRAIRSTDGLVALAGADAITVESTAFFQLAPTGQRVLLTHELTHLATGAAVDPTVPIWLEEGFADYVGFGDSGIADGAAASTLIEQVRAGHQPTALPLDDDFTKSGRQLAVAYQASWLFCRTLADRDGEAALVQVYRKVAYGGSSVEVAIQEVTGRSFDDAVLDWQRKIATLAAALSPTS